MKKSQAATLLALTLILLVGEKEIPKFYLSNEAKPKLGGFFGSEYGGAIGDQAYRLDNAAKDIAPDLNPPNNNSMNDTTRSAIGFRDPSKNWNLKYVGGAVGGGMAGAWAGAATGGPAGSYIFGLIGSAAGPAGTIFGVWAGGSIGSWLGAA